MTPLTNHLIQSLPQRDRLRMQKACELVQLELSLVLCQPGEATRHVYFPIDSFISLLALDDGKPAVEVGMVGSEGMLGAELALGVATSPLHALVQGAGSAWRITPAGFRREMAASPALRRITGRYLYVVMAQQSASAACLRFHVVGQRLARWLLMSQDRARTKSFRVTHEFLAYMLGVRRAGITVAATALQRDGLIAYTRGRIEVLDRKGLENAACSCYANDRAAYASQLE
jgi:CRP-like cAMP-binding protein